MKDDPEIHYLLGENYDSIIPGCMMCVPASSAATAVCQYLLSLHIQITFQHSGFKKSGHILTINHCQALWNVFFGSCHKKKKSAHSILRFYDRIYECE